MRRDARYGRREYTCRIPQRRPLGSRRISAHKSIQNGQKVPVFGPRALAETVASKAAYQTVNPNEKCRIFLVLQRTLKVALLGHLAFNAGAIYLICRGMYVSG
jgi:hypothetical protein